MHCGSCGPSIEEKKNAVVYIDRIQYLLELVPDPKKGEVRLPPTLNGAGGIYK